MGVGFVVAVGLVMSIEVKPQLLTPTMLRVEKQDGTVLDFTVEVARTQEEIYRGLMFRKEMPARYGMIFILPVEREAEFWMKNTLIPLDMVFIGADGQIKHIHPMAKPLDTTLVPSLAPVKAVLELNGGETQALGIMPGDKVLHQDLGNFTP
ncbi:MAG: DUF192 domain-containing protein [Alphaproteobacteria bacterium]|nr:DUF192 domain-containing protein [Alphaproteobacteria bacterium]